MVDRLGTVAGSLFLALYDLCANGRKGMIGMMGGGVEKKTERAGGCRESGAEKKTAWSS